MIKEKIAWEGKEVLVTWLNYSEIEVTNLDFPFTQVYGICFNEQNEILIMNEHGDGWKIPGGSHELDETPEQTLQRELFEEVDVEVDELYFLGAFLNDWNGKPSEDRFGYDKHYQLRYICKIKNLLPQLPDPDTGKIYPRKFVPANEVTKHVLWGKTGDQMFRDAIDLAKEKYFS